jgi:uncharacterized protein YyaL (SSP411 family)
MVLNHLRMFNEIDYPWNVQLTLFNYRNAVSLRNLVRLAVLLQDPSYSKKAEETVQSFRLSLSKFPFAIPALVASFMLVTRGLKEVIHNVWTKLIIQD